TVTHAYSEGLGLMYGFGRSVLGALRRLLRIRSGGAARAQWSGAARAGGWGIYGTWQVPDWATWHMSRRPRPVHNGVGEGVCERSSAPQALAVAAVQGPFFSFPARVATARYSPRCERVSLSSLDREHPHSN